MNVIVFASRKGGSGKSTLAAHLAAHVQQAFPSGPADRCRSAGLADALAQAARQRRAAAGEGHGGGARYRQAGAPRNGYEWVFIDTPPNMSAIVTDAIAAATLVVIPARLTVFDLAAIKETMDLARAAAQTLCRRDQRRAGAARQYRVAIRARGAAGPQQPQRAGLVRSDHQPQQLLAGARRRRGRQRIRRPSRRRRTRSAALWSAIDKSVKAINGAYEGAAMHRVAA